MKNSRRDFLKGLTATSVLSATSVPLIATSVPMREADVGEEERNAEFSPGTENIRPAMYDGPESPLFKPLPFEGNTAFSSLKESLSDGLAEAAVYDTAVVRSARAA